ncbi:MULTISPECIES: hypothetical protein [unclassified Variovorax]|uniref:hypothetical protein n=1 Tax=unclassified Variovorax TaxID=663243 RepID=UPI003F44AA70
MKHLSSFPIAHAAVLALVVGAFLIDGHVNRTDRRCTLAAPDVPSAPSSTLLDVQRRAPTARSAC